VDFPADFHRAGTDVTPYLQPKVLVSAKRSANNPWRLVVRYDDQGVIFRETLHSVWPNSGDERDAHALVAVLASSVASCWVDELDAKMSFGVSVLRSLPVPDEGQEWEMLSDIGAELLRQGNSGHFRAQTFELLEEVILRAYRLPQEAGEVLASHFAGFDAPEGRPRFNTLSVEPLSHESARWRYGSVLDVDNDRIRLWVQGVTPADGQLLPIPRGFLGWLCEPGATFDVDIQGRDLAHAVYRYQSRAFLELEELLPSDAVIE
jgi:hypothetical protein